MTLAILIHAKLCLRIRFVWVCSRSIENLESSQTFTGKITQAIRTKSLSLTHGYTLSLSSDYKMCKNTFATLLLSDQ